MPTSRGKTAKLRQYQVSAKSGPYHSEHCYQGVKSVILPGRIGQELDIKLSSQPSGESNVLHFEHSYNFVGRWTV